MRASNKYTAIMAILVVIMQGIIASPPLAQKGPARPVARQPAVAPAAAPKYRAKRTADGKPNLSGIWQAMNTAEWDIQAHDAKAGPLVVMGAVGAIPAGLGVVEDGPLPYRSGRRWRRTRTSRPVSPRRPPSRPLRHPCPASTATPRRTGPPR